MSSVLDDAEKHFLSKMAVVKSSTFAFVKPVVKPNATSTTLCQVKLHWEPKPEVKRGSVLSRGYTEPSTKLLTTLDYPGKLTTLDYPGKPVTQPAHTKKLEQTENLVVDEHEEPQQQHRPSRKSIDQTAAHNWILQQENKDAQVRYKKRVERLRITFEKQVSQTSEMLTRRLKEVRHMCKVRGAISILPDMTNNQKQLVESLTETNSVEFLAKRRKAWTLLDHFRHAANMVLIMVRGFNDTRRRYHHADMIGSKPSKSEDDIFTNVKFKREEPVISAGMAPELFMAFTTQSEYRKHEEITKILWVIRASKAFKDMFPEDMEYELARRVTYEKYDNGRVIAYQHRTPERFYHVLSGKCNLLTEYKLNAGTVTRVVGEMCKGEHSNSDEVVKLWNRETHLVAKGSVELLSLDRDDYLHLTKTEEGLPLDYMRTIELFSEFPLEELEGEPTESIQCEYIGRGQIIAIDSNRAPWIILVKSGQVKVIRMQPVLDIESYHNYDKLAEKKPHDPISTQPPPLKHADAMMDILSYQRKVKAMVNQSRQSRRKCITPMNRRQLAKSSTTQLIITPGSAVNAEGEDKTRKRRVRLQIPQPKSTSHTVEPIETIDENEITDSTKQPETPSAKRTIPKFSLPVLINVPVLNVREATAPIEKVWLSEDMTLPDIPSVSRKKQLTNKTLPERSTYVQLDVLTAGDVFGLSPSEAYSHLQKGLDHLHEAKFSEAKGVTLVSDGAEIISVSKRFFLQHANNNTMLKVETMFKDYMSMDEARDALYCKANWNHYKNHMLERTLNALTRKRK